MKKLGLLIFAFLVAWCVEAQMPLFRNAFTTNVPGAYVRGNLDFGTAANWFRVNSTVTNLSTLFVADDALFGAQVGIETNTPATTLDVHGSVRGTNVLVWPPRWDDVRIPMTSLSSPSDTPGKVILRGGLAVYGFDDASTEQLNFELQLPHGITTNGNYGIRVHVHWTCTNAIAAANSNVVWGLEYVIADPLTLFDTTTITNRVTNAIPAPFFHQLAEWQTITNDIKESAVMVGRIFREGGNGSDTLAGDAMGLSLDAHYPRISFGSTGEYGDY